MFKHLLVPTDGSELSEGAVERAVSFAREAGAKITFFTAKPDFPVSYYGEGALVDPMTPEKFAEMAEQHAREILNKAVREALASHVECHTISMVSDTPYEAIIKVADDHACDLIFMASHGRRGLTGLLLGSETQKVLTHSDIPVLVYR